MRKLILVAWREFRQRVRNRRFIIGTLAVPLIMMVIWAFTGVMGGGGEANPLEDLGAPGQQQMTIGYVDYADLIRRIPEPVPSGVFQAFASEDSAKAALQGGEIDAYYVVPENYRQSGDILRVSQNLPASPPDSQWFNWVLVANLFPQASTDQIARLNWPFNNTGPEFVTLAPSGDQGGGGNPMLPFIVTIAVMIPLFTSGAYLLQSVTQEKSNRVMEILLVSLRPFHMLAGKLVGLGALTFVQYVAWGAIGGFALTITGQNPAQLLSGISLSMQEVVLVVPYALAGFLLYAGLMAGIGALAPDMEGSRTWVFIISLPMMIPVYLWMAILNAPNGPIAVALSMIPFSAPVAMLMRMTTTAVPEWQLITSLVLLLLTGVGMLWLMARLFRVQTLLSGESLSLRRFLRAFQGS
ncbi:MAG: ABC transporter permease [Anaerolineales bacterium]|jgi:ABC-2 type transport system permease protein